MTNKLYAVTIANVDTGEHRVINVIAKKADEAMEKVNLEKPGNEYIFEVKFAGDVHVN